MRMGSDSEQYLLQSLYLSSVWRGLIVIVIVTVIVLNFLRLKQGLAYAWQALYH